MQIDVESIPYGIEVPARTDQTYQVCCAIIHLLHKKEKPNVAKDLLKEIDDALIHTTSGFSLLNKGIKLQYVIRGSNVSYILKDRSNNLEEGLMQSLSTRLQVPLLKHTYQLTGLPIKIPKGILRKALKGLFHLDLLTACDTDFKLSDQAVLSLVIEEESLANFCLKECMIRGLGFRYDPEPLLPMLEEGIQQQLTTFINALYYLSEEQRS